MTVTLRKPESEAYKNFSEEVKRRARQEYGHFVYGDEEVGATVEICTEEKKCKIHCSV